ncbi:hypothetical protein, partial [Streptomyces alboviridis]|uniref:hypothetical protein n=1 Tax=Streptomyces alboviridis TaxID=67269 RepID=UPI000515E86F
MSETAKDDPFTAITLLEASAFRIGQLARQIRAEHGDAVELDAALVFSYRDSHASPQLKLKARGIDNALAVAAALGIELETDGIHAGA